MKFQKLGKTDIDVSVVALGTWGLAAEVSGQTEILQLRT